MKSRRKMKNSQKPLKSAFKNINYSYDLMNSCECRYFIRSNMFCLEFEFALVSG